MAGAGSVGGAAVPGNADQGDFHLVGVAQFDQRQAHKRCDARVARKDGARDGFESISVHDVFPNTADN
ncbi:MAG: hypothetical protein VW338_06400, partial [Rhodospirillaceae bacterium]